jgi:hypothetical protein
VLYIYSFLILDYCRVGYNAHQYTNSMICLKYVTMDTTYPDAVNSCRGDGGDLIRIESKQKFDIFKAYFGRLYVALLYAKRC